MVHVVFMGGTGFARARVPCWGVPLSRTIVYGGVY